jgi:hypothetical protein
MGVLSSGFGTRLAMPGVVCLVLLSVAVATGFGSAYNADSAEEAIISSADREAIVQEAMSDPVEPPWYNEYLPEQYQEEPHRLEGWTKSLTEHILRATLTLTGAVSAWAWQNQWFPQWAAKGLSLGMALSALSLAGYRTYSLVRRARHGRAA